MSKTLKEVFDVECKSIKFNKNLADELYRFQTAFVNKNEDHMAFFGGNLTGVHVVRWAPSDNNRFFNDVLGLDELDLTDAIEEVTDIDQSFKVSGSTFNLICMYLIHRFLTAPGLDEKIRVRAANDVALIFNYRMLTGLLGLFFKYPVNEDIAKLTYASLNFKYVLKKLGSWNAVLAFRAEELTDPKRLHYKNLVKFKVDLDIAYAITDSRGRLADMLKNIYAEFIKIHARGDRISTTSSMQVNTDGIEVLKDKSHGVESYTQYALSVLPDKNSFIKPELIDVVLKLMFTASKSQFVTTLEWMSTEFNGKHHADIEKLIQVTLRHSYEYLSSNSAVLHNTKDLPGFLSKIKGVYLSSRSTDEELLEMRELGGELIKVAVGTHSDNAIAAIRTALFLYIDLRAYTRQHYSH